MGLRDDIIMSQHIIYFRSVPVDILPARNPMLTNHVAILLEI